MPSAQSVDGLPGEGESMASIRRQRNRFEIRECIATLKGPRQATLASFSGPLTPEVLDEAQERARRPFRRDQLIASALRMGIPVVERRHFPEARALLGKLQRGARLDPRLVTLLRSALDGLPAEPIPTHLRDAADWIGQSERERGHALRGLVRTADRIVGSRPHLRQRPRETFPRFSSDTRGAVPSDASQRDSGEAP